MIEKNVDPLITKLCCFVPLSDEDKDFIEKLVGSTPRSIPARQRLTQEGSAPDDVVLVIEGLACRFKQLLGHRRQIVSFMMAGDLSDAHGFTRALDHGVETVSDCRILDLPRRALVEMMTRPAIAEAMNVSSAVEDAIIKEWLINVGRRTSVERLAHLLCEFLFRVRAIGLADDNVLDFKVTRADLADSTCLSVVHVSRILQDLRDGGIIRLDGETLEVRDPAALQRMGSFSEDYLELINPHPNTSPFARPGDSPAP